MQKIVDLRTHEIQSNHTLLKKSHEQLAALNQEKNEILSIVAHDLRNPLGSIESIMQLLEEDIRKGNKLQALEWLGTQLSSVKQARGLVDQLLNDNKIEQGFIMAS
ncbi:histidine kinase dimerization/phospho-acceptor domain-containing protein, partial [Arthrospira platensis SPKY1]|nr:histidine kinase dimerization/phospho-acceptor domain-containing protein [Arthrospira platensis SPKY1]